MDRMVGRHGGLHRFSDLNTIGPQKQWSDE